MTVNDMIKTIGYTQNKLNYFIINIFEPKTDRWIRIKQPTSDEYIYLCDREVFEWMIEDSNTISITIYAKSDDMEIFYDQIV